MILENFFFFRQLDYLMPDSPEISDNKELSDSNHEITIECGVEGDIKILFLLFSLDKGQTWYQVEMMKSEGIYSVKIPNVSLGTKILYIFKAISNSNEEFIDNNSGQFYSQTAEIIPKKEKPIPSQPPAFPTEKDPTEDLIPQAPDEMFSEPEIVNSDISAIESETNELDDFAFLEEVEQEASESETFEEPLEDIKPGEGVVQPKPEPVAYPPEFEKNPFLFDNPLTTPETSSKPINSQEIISELAKNIPFAPKPPEIDDSRTSKISSRAIEFPHVNKISNFETNQVRYKPENQLPIVVYNPFPADYGDIDYQSLAINSFSDLIESPIKISPAKKKSFIIRSNNQQPIKCQNCKAVLNDKWKICPICGGKN